MRPNPDRAVPPASSLDAGPTPFATARKGEALATIAVIAAAASIFFFHLGTYGLWEPDEGRYAEIAREMLALRDYIVPHLNYVPYVEKPPLLYWLTAAVMRLLGVNEFAARLVNATAALAGVVTVHVFARRTFGRRHAILAGAILASSGLYALMAQVLTTDMLLTATLSVALFALYLHWREGGAWCWIMYAAMGLAILTKGPIGIAIPSVTGAAFLLLEHDTRGALRRFHVLLGLSLTGVIAAPWFIAIAIRQPGFADFYFVGEHLRRFFQSSYSHGEPIYYYAPVLLAGMLPWSLLMPFVPWRALEPNPARRFCLIAALVTVAIFSLASAKLIPYILPALPPLAVVMADGLLAFADRDSASGVDSRWLAFGASIIVMLGVTVLGVALCADRFVSANPMTVRPVLYVAGGAIMIGGSLALVLFRGRHLFVGLSAIAATAAVTMLIASYGRIMAEPSRSYARLARTIAVRAPAARLICYPRYIQSLPFYCRRRVILVGAKTELAFGADHAPDGAEFFFTRPADLLRLWNEPEPSVLIVDRGAFASLAPHLGAYSIIASDAKKIAVMRAQFGNSGQAEPRE